MIDTNEEILEDPSLEADGLDIDDHNVTNMPRDREGCSEDARPNLISRAPGSASGRSAVHARQSHAVSAVSRPLR
jgi:hypothetical protein